MLSFCVLFLSFRCLPERCGPTRWILKGHGSALFNKWLVSRPDQWPCRRRILKHISVFTWAHRRERTALWFGYGNVSVPDVFTLQKWICCLCWWCVLYLWEGEKISRPGRVTVSWCVHSAEPDVVTWAVFISKSCSSAGADGEVRPSWRMAAVPVCKSISWAVAGVFHSILLFVTFVHLPLQFWELHTCFVSRLQPAVCSVCACFFCFWTIGCSLCVNMCIYKYGCFTFKSLNLTCNLLSKILFKKVSYSHQGWK